MKQEISIDVVEKISKWQTFEKWLMRISQIAGLLIMVFLIFTKESYSVSDLVVCSSSAIIIFIAGTVGRCK